MSTPLIVVDSITDWDPYFPSESVVSFDDLLHSVTLQKQRKLQIINMCDTKKNLSQGYYCSLIAESRGYKVIPSTNTLNDLRNKELALIHSEDVSILLPPPNSSEDSKISFLTFFGESSEPFRGIAQALFERVACPILQVELVYKGAWGLKQLKPLSLRELDDAQQTEFASALERFNSRVWRNKRSNKKYRWEMAILVNENEQLPPSDQIAIKKLIQAAAQAGIEAEQISPKSYNRISEYDALFIRETTEINHHTYQFSRKAHAEGLVVIDDPVSILRCCNKVFLHDAFRHHKIPTPRTIIVSTKDLDNLSNIEAHISYPMVLKIPNGSFSRGVEKVTSREALKETLKKMLLGSALVLIQEFFYTKFDWRIGVLNNRPLFASRYYMVDGHWQIYHHEDSKVVEGKHDTMPTYEVPRKVLDYALKAAKVVGDGLYGIDLKQDGNRVVVIEVNDNPSLEHGVEDAFLGDELYMQIMNEFARRLEQRGR